MRAARPVAIKRRTGGQIRQWFIKAALQVTGLGGLKGGGSSLPHIAAAWQPFPFAAGPSGKKRKSASVQLALSPLRRRRRTKPVFNIGPGKQRRSFVIDAPQHPQDWRAKMIAAAWKARDWWTLKAMGEIDEVPEP